MIIALAGNQNCGKTTLFNRLTGSRQRVGNWPGVTVDQKTGNLLHRWLPLQTEPVEIVDLPGVYSLAPFSQEEEITRRFLLHQAPDVIINVVDATHLERNLYLTLQLLELGRPLVLALNLMDQVRAGGGQIDVPLLAQRLGVPVIPVCARSGEGLATLMREAAQMAHDAVRPPERLRCRGPAQYALQELAELIGSKPLLQHWLKANGYPSAPFSAAAALLEAGENGLSKGFAHEMPDGALVPGILRTLEVRTGQSSRAALAEGRYRWLERLVSECCTQQALRQRDLRLDDWLLRSGWAVPVLALVLCLVFYIAFGIPGQWLTDALTHLLQAGMQVLKSRLERWQVAAGLQSLLLDGLLPGLCSVLSFLPPLMLLMFLVNLLEESGYLARVAFLMDRPLRAIGLSGRSLIPFLLGFGCTVPAVFCAGSIKNRRERILTVLLTPLMSCGAKLPVYLLLARAFFPGAQLRVVAVLYLMGILLAALAGWLLKKLCPPRDQEPFLLELPSYRMPSLGNALGELLHKSREFLSRTFSVILLATLAVWVLSRYRFSLKPAAGLSDSMLGGVAGWLSPLLAPCGFGHTAAAAALLTGLLAKENIVSSLTVLAGVPSFPDALSAFAFLVFVLLYPPCAAATAAISREVRNSRLAAAVYAGHLLMAWLVSMIIYQAGRLLL